MGSNVVFGSPHSDRCLKFFRYLDIIMLLFLGDAFWRLDPIQLWIWMTGIRHLMMDDEWFEVIRFSDIPYTYAILGHISLSIEICRSSWSHMILTTHGMHDELIIYCYLIIIPNGVSLEPSSQACIFRHSDVVILPFLRYAFLIYESNSVMDVDD